MEERRVGTRERELAMGALDEHHREGRLTTPEYTRRSATAASARVRSQLDPLFDDLPEPHPVYPGDGAPAAVAPPGAGSGDARPHRLEEDLPDLIAPVGATVARHAGLLSLLSPVIAVALFWVTGARFPMIFLLVPVAIGVLGYLGHRHGH